MKYLIFIAFLYTSCITPQLVETNGSSSVQVLQSDTFIRYILNWKSTHVAQLPKEWRQFDFVRLSNFALGQKSEAAIDAKLNMILKGDAGASSLLENAELMSAALMDDTVDFSYVLMPEILNLMPENAKLDVRIYYGMFNDIQLVRESSTTSAEIVYDVLHPQWQLNPEILKNYLVRDIFQLLYKNFRPESDVLKSKNFVQEYFFWYLHMKGMSTFAAIKANINKVEIKEFLFLDQYKDKMPQFFDRLNKLNQFLKTKKIQAKSEEWKILVQKFGIEDRDFNLVGAYMALRIEEQFGLEHLKMTIQKGPAEFLRSYSSLPKKAEYDLKY